MHTVAVINGSLRKGSINRKLAQAIAKLADGKLEFRFVEIGDLPLYNDDLFEDGEPPATVSRFKAAIANADAVLFVCPEYNRSFPAALKNAIDWGTRPYGRNVWRAKPAAVLGTSPGAIGAAVAQNHLKSVLQVVDLVVMGQPEVYYSWKADAFGADGSVVDEKTKAVFQRFVDRFALWIERTREPVIDAQPGPRS